MTAKEKAKELISKFNFEHLGDKYIIHQNVEESKRCALITVDELIKEVEHWQPRVNYLNEVKQEINQL